MRKIELYVAVVVIVALAFGGYVFLYVQMKMEQAYVEERQGDCIEQLAAYHNHLPRREYGEVNFLYNRHADLCLYRSNFVADQNGGYYFEKFIVDAFTGETLAEYAELDGQGIKGDLAAYTAVYQRLFFDAND